MQAKPTTALEHAGIARLVDILGVKSAVCALQTMLDKARDKPDLVSPTLHNSIRQFLN